MLHHRELSYTFFKASDLDLVQQRRRPFLIIIIQAPSSGAGNEDACSIRHAVAFALRRCGWLLSLKNWFILALCV